jgi:hypothetical protein
VCLNPPFNTLTSCAFLLSFADTNSVRYILRRDETRAFETICRLHFDDLVAVGVVDRGVRVFASREKARDGSSFVSQTFEGEKTGRRFFRIDKFGSRMHLLRERFQHFHEIFEPKIRKTNLREFGKNDFRKSVCFPNRAGEDFIFQTVLSLGLLLQSRAAARSACFVNVRNINSNVFRRVSSGLY